MAGTATKYQDKEYTEGAASSADHRGSLGMSELVHSIRSLIKPAINVGVPEGNSLKLNSLSRNRHLADALNRLAQIAER